MEINRCLFCGKSLEGQVSTIKGVQPRICRYGMCKHTIQNFKLRIKQQKNNKNPIVAEFAKRVESKVFDDNQIADPLNEELIRLIKLNRRKVFPLIK